MNKRTYFILEKKEDIHLFKSNKVNLLQALILFIVLNLFSCNKLSKEIQRSLLNDSTITEEEFKHLEIISQKKNLSEEELFRKIDDIALSLSKKRRNPIQYPPTIWKEEKIESTNQVVTFNVYLENSASMKGYVNGPTDFKETILNILTAISNKKEEANFFLINSEKSEQIRQEIDQYITFLEPDSLKVKTSLLDDVINTVVEKYIENKQPAVLISDFIFSKDTQTRTGILSVKTRLSKSIKNLDKKRDAILVIKCESQFKGWYLGYKKDLKLAEEINSKRPYYIWIVGPKSLIYNFTEKYYIKQSVGFLEQFTISNTSQDDPPYHHILKKTYSKGQFRFCKDSKERCIEDIRFNTRSDVTFQLGIAVDLSEIPVSEAYKSNPANYIIACPREDILEIEKILPIDSIHPNDEQFRESATHILIIRLKGDSFYKGNQVFNIKIKNTIPEWIELSSTIDDQNMKHDPDRLNRTYGFKNLIEGTYQALNPNLDQNYFFNIPIEIRNKE
jgi:hypothetical protein